MRGKKPGSAARKSSSAGGAGVRRRGRRPPYYFVNGVQGSLALQSRLLNLNPGRARRGLDRARTSMVLVVGENMNNRLKKKLIYRRHHIGLLIAAIESLYDLEESFHESEAAR